MKQVLPNALLSFDSENYGRQAPQGAQLILLAMSECSVKTVKISYQN